MDVTYINDKNMDVKGEKGVKGVNGVIIDSTYHKEKYIYNTAIPFRVSESFFSI